MRILMTTDTVGGVWTFTQELATGLLRNGCAVCLVSLGKLASEAQRGQCEALAHAWPAQFLYELSDTPLEWMDANHRAYADAAPLLTRMAGEFQPDVLLSSQFCFGALPLAMPKVVVAHSDVLSWAEWCREGALEDSAWLRRYRDLVQHGLAFADAVVAPTRWMLDALARNFALPKEGIVIPNGRNIAGGDYRARKLQALTAGRLWDEAKNLAILRQVKCPFPIVVAGDCPAETEPFNNATFLGPLPPDELLGILRESAVYICTSRYEPFGLAPLEAALCGCAVLANDIPSLQEVWQDGALYFSDAANLTSLLHDLGESPGKLRAARAHSLARAQLFTAERMTNAYLQLLQRSLACAEEASCVS